MDLINSLRNYILEDQFKIIYEKNKVDIINHDTIDHFDNNKIMIRYKDEEVIVKGENLVVSRLLNDEVLIEGQIKSIEFR